MIGKRKIAAGIVIGLIIGSVFFIASERTEIAKSSTDPTASVTFNESGDDLVINVIDYENSDRIVITTDNRTYYLNKSDGDRLVTISNLVENEVFAVQPVQDPRPTNLWVEVKGDETLLQK